MSSQWYNIAMKRIVIITGASSGIGREFARNLVQIKETDEMWLVARRKDRLEDLAQELSVPTRLFDLDLTRPEAIDTIGSALSSEYCVVDTLVNNAGFGTYGPFCETAPERELEMVDLNVRALTALCALVLPKMDNKSKIINVASLAAFIPLGNFAVYAATKAYVLSFSVALAAEVADRGITVTALCPGPVDTEFAKVASNGARQFVLKGKDTATVVTRCLKDVRRGKHISLIHPQWKIMALLSRFVGRYLYARHSYLNDKRPSQ